MKVLPYKRTRSEWNQYCTALYHSCPKANWSKLRVGDIVMNNYIGFRVTRIPPKRGWVDAENIVSNEPIRLKKKECGGLILATDEFKSVALIDHEKSVKEAKSKGRKIPLKVQYDYLFLFTLPPSSWSYDTLKLVQEAFTNFNYQRNKENKLSNEIDVCIKKCKDSIRYFSRLKRSAAKGVDVNPAAIDNVVKNYESLIQEGKREVEIYKYIKSHILNVFGE